MKYKSNRNIVFSCNYHVVFCPKYRRPVLVDGVDERFKEIARPTSSVSRSPRWRSCPTTSTYSCQSIPS